MSQSTRNFLIGITTLTALVGGVVLLMLFGELEAVFRPRYQLTINSTHAEGLRSGSTVELNGVPIGLVGTVAATGDPHYPVQIVAMINHAIRIPANVRAYANPAVLGGSATLQLESAPSPAGQTALLPADGTAKLDGEIRSQLMEQITTELDKRMKPLLEGLGEFQTLARNLNDLVEPVDPDDAGESHNLRTAIVMLNQVLADVQEALSMAKSWLGDDQLRADARSAVANANVLIEQATQTLDQFSRLATRMEQDADSVTTQLVPVLTNLGETLAMVRALTERATAGQGTVGQLLNNPDLYNSLNDAAIQLERTLQELQQLAEKMKAEGVDINF